MKLCKCSLDFQEKNAHSGEKESIKKRPFNRVYFFIIIILSFLTRFPKIEIPKMIGFDEPFFGDFVNKYMNRTFFIDVHPPVGRLILTLEAYFIGYRGETCIKEQFEKYKDDGYVKLRRICTFHSFLCPPLIYLSMFNFGFSDISCFVSSYLCVLENSMIVEGRHILTDGLLHSFVCASIFFLSRAMKCKVSSKKWRLNFVLSVLFAATAGATKLTSLSLFPIIVVFVAVQIFFDEGHFLSMKYSRKVIFCALFIVTVDAVFFLVGNIIHVSLGQQYIPDIERQREKDGISRDSYDHVYNQTNVIGKALAFISDSIEFNSKFTVDVEKCAVLSKWYQWPIANVSFITESFDKEKHIRVLTNYNLFNCIAGSFFIIPFCYYILSNFKVYEYKISIALCFVIAYMSSYFPFYFIKRTTLMYHYIIPLIFIFFIIGTSVDILPINKKIFSSIILICSTVSFLLFMPITYPIPTTNYVKFITFNRKWMRDARRYKVI